MGYSCPIKKGTQRSVHRDHKLSFGHIEEISFGDWKSGSFYDNYLLINWVKIILYTITNCRILDIQKIILEIFALINIYLSVFNFEPLLGYQY